MNKKPKQWLPWKIAPGVEFATDFERGCIAREVPDADGAFLGTDSEGVECKFHVMMVLDHPQHVNPIGMAQ